MKSFLQTAKDLEKLQKLHSPYSNFLKTETLKLFVWQLLLTVPKNAPPGERA